MYSYFDDNINKSAIFNNGKDIKRILFDGKNGDDYNDWPDDKIDITNSMPFIIPRASSVPAYMHSHRQHKIRASKKISLHIFWYSVWQKYRDKHFGPCTRSKELFLKELITNFDGRYKSYKKNKSYIHLSLMINKYCRVRNWH